jgi:flagellar basal-body rod protein FlgB
MQLQIQTRVSDQIARYLDLVASQAKLCAANMANIDTPGFQTLGMNFEEEMRDALKKTDAGQESRPVRIRSVEGLIARPDGNDVSMDRESLDLAEAQLKFKTGVALLREEYQRVLDAIHADSK